jgi:hypothetical protein
MEEQNSARFWLKFGQSLSEENAFRDFQ